MNLLSLDNAKSADIRKATAALVRAGIRARQIALHTGTAVITWQDGKVVRTMPHASSTSLSAEEPTILHRAFGE